MDNNNTTPSSSSLLLNAQIDDQLQSSAASLTPDELLKERQFKSHLENLVNHKSQHNSNTTVTTLASKSLSMPMQRHFDQSELDSDVFGFDEDNHNATTNRSNYDRPLTSDDEDEEDNEEIDEQQQKINNQIRSNILKNRNENITGAETTMQMVDQKLHSNSSSNSSSRQQYSCSLPRDIPFMMNMGKSTAGATVSSSNKMNNTLKLDENDEIIEEVTNEDSNSADGLSDDKVNIGEAISNLASSIVVKDGRELFGGVPSRRIPINSISQSYF